MEKKYSKFIVTNVWQSLGKVKDDYFSQFKTIMLNFNAIFRKYIFSFSLFESTFMHFISFLQAFYSKIFTVLKQLLKCLMTVMWPDISALKNIKPKYTDWKKILFWKRILSLFTKRKLFKLFTQQAITTLPYRKSLLMLQE